MSSEWTRGRSDFYFYREENSSRLFFWTQHLRMYECQKNCKVKCLYVSEWVQSLMKTLEGIKISMIVSLSCSHTHVVPKALIKRHSGVCVRSPVWHKETVGSELESERERKVKNTLKWFSLIFQTDQKQRSPHCECSVIVLCLQY